MRKRIHDENEKSRSSQSLTTGDLSLKLKNKLYKTMLVDILTVSSLELEGPNIFYGI